MSLGNQRELFDIDDGVAYLNCAAYTPLLKTSYEAGIKGLDRKYHPWNINNNQTPAEVKNLRVLFSGLINAQPDDIAIVNSTSYGVAVMASNLPIQRSQEIVIITDQFPSNVFSWRHLANQKEANVKVVPRPNNDDWTSNVLEFINTNTAIAALPPCHWSDGTRLDLLAIGAKCRDVGAALCIDATQAAGAMEIDVARIRPDFMVASAYKWLLCPYTLAFLYVAPHRQNGIPLERHRWNMADVQADASEVRYPREFAHGAGRFDMGERNNFINIPMAVAALEQLTIWTPSAIQETLRPLTSLAANLAQQRNWHVAHEKKRVGHFIGIRPPTSPPSDIAEKMKERGVYVSLRGSDAIRIGPYLFNDETDIHRTFETLDVLLD